MQGDAQQSPIERRTHERTNDHTNERRPHRLHHRPSPSHARLPTSRTTTMACMGNFAAFNWTSERDQLKSTTDNADNDDRVCNTASRPNVAAYGSNTYTASDESPRARKKWSDSMESTPLHDDTDTHKDTEAMHANDRHRFLYSTRVDALLHDQALRDWPNCPDYPKIGSQYDKSAAPSYVQVPQAGNVPNRWPRQGCDLTK